MTSPTNYARGIDAEAQAKALLQAAGYSILAERYRNKGGEIDLIARDGDCLVFIEVKTRPTLDDGLHAITPTQQRRIIAAAEGYLSEHENDSFQEMRFDVVIIPREGLPNHLKHAFIAE